MANLKQRMIALGLFSTALVILLLHQLLHYQCSTSNSNEPVSRNEELCFMNKSSQCNVRVKRPLKPPAAGKSSFCMGKRCPNIIYLLADDVGYGDVEYNNGIASTPHLNSMASGSHSIHFTRFYAGGPTCSPTRGTLLTGRNHNRYCIWHADLGEPAHDLTCPSLGPLPPSELTVAEILQRAGYHTSIYGKWHVGDLKEIEGGNAKWHVSHPGMHGFTDWMVTERQVSTLLPNCKCSSEYSCMFEGQDYYVRFCQNYWRMDPQTGQLKKYPKQIFDDSDFLVDQLENLLKTRDPTVPFFTIIAFHSVHAPFRATPHWMQYYSNKGYSGTQLDYLGTLSGLDEAIGRVRQLLKHYGVYDNTMLWFSSDNGPQKGLPGSSGGLRGRKGQLWEGGIRVPGIIEWPSVIKQNRLLTTPVVTSDLLPTVADIIGIHLPRNVKLDGISLLPLLQNKTDKRGTNINFAFHILKGRLDSSYSGAVVGDRYKYIANFNRGQMQESFLFDLDHESSEVTDVSSSHPELTVSMRAELSRFLRSVNESATEIGCLLTHDRRTTKNCY